MRKILRFLFLMGLLAVGLFLIWLFHDPILTLLGEFLVVQDLPQPAAAIVVLSGESPSRALQGWELYKQNLAPMILLTQGSRLSAVSELERRGLHFPEPAELDRKMLIDLGAPDKNITLLSSRANSTYSEALLTRSFFGQQPPHRLLLVTSRYHSRRAKMAFRYVFGEGTEILSIPTTYDDFDPGSWWKNRNSTRNLLMEYQKGIIYGCTILWDRFNPWKTPSIPTLTPAKE